MYPCHFNNILSVLLCDFNKVFCFSVIPFLFFLAKYFMLQSLVADSQRKTECVLAMCQGHLSMQVYILSLGLGKGTLYKVQFKVTAF